jgi:hypothetical protein
MKKNQPTGRNPEKRRQLHPGQLRQSYLARRDEDPEFRERWGYIGYEPNGDDYWDCYDPMEDYIDQFEIDNFQLEQFLKEILDPVLPFSSLGDIVTLSDDSEPKNNTGEVAEEQIPKTTIEERIAEYLITLRRFSDRSVELRSRIFEAYGGPKTVEFIKSAIPDQPKMVMYIVLFSPFWIRDPHTWNKTGNTSLLDHLFVLHEVPGFLYEEWSRSGSFPRPKWISWFILFGQGGSLNKVSKLYWWRPFIKLPQHLQDIPSKSSAIETYTYEQVKGRGGSETAFRRALKLATMRYRWVIPNRFPQYLWEAPIDLSPWEACIYAEVRRLGGSETDFRRILRDPALVIDPTEKSTDSAYSSFWQNAVKWFVSHRDEITDEQSRLILSWALHEYTEAKYRERSFSWRGRSANSVVDRSIEYHRSINRSRPNYQWHSHGWDWDYDDSFANRWSFVELTSSAELSIEGGKMHHCVAIYAAKCASGFSTIVSVRKNDSPCVTVQINLTSSGILQAVGPCNRKTTTEEKKILNLWLRTIVHQKPLQE